MSSLYSHTQPNPCRRTLLFILLFWPLHDWRAALLQAQLAQKVKIIATFSVSTATRWGKRYKLKQDWSQRKLCQVNLNISSFISPEQMFYSSSGSNGLKKLRRKNNNLVWCKNWKLCQVNLNTSSFLSWTNVLQFQWLKWFWKKKTKKKKQYAGSICSEKLKSN